MSSGTGAGVRRAVMIVDLDRLAAINAVRGHRSGDLVLAEVARRLSAVCGEHRAVVLLVRLAGDEFAIVLEGESRAGCESLASELYDAISRPLALAGATLLLDAGIAIALPCGELTLWELASRASLALRPLKRGGRLPRIVVYEDGAHAVEAERLALGLDLRRAIAGGQLELEYQPIVEFSRRRAIGYEALVRWSHPERGRLEPLRFVPLAEDVGLIAELGDWVLAHACAQAREWRATAAGQAPFVTVNLSARQLEDPKFLDRFQDVLRASGLEPGRLKVELTESVLAAGMDSVVAPLTALRQAGIGVLLDDFGTGCSSLQYLRELPLDAVKLDRMFTRGLEASAGAWSLARAAISMVSELDLDVIAEGVETAAQLAQLRSLGCPLGQGYYFARPLPPARLSLEALEGSLP